MMPTAGPVYFSANGMPSWTWYGTNFTTSSITTATIPQYASYGWMPPVPAAPAPEDDVAWLQRRVREITDLAPRAR